MRQRTFWLVLVVAVGVGLGAFSHGSSGLPGAWRWIGNFGALWVAVAFFAGRVAGNFNRGTVTRGAVAGAATLACASVVHYVPHRMLREGISLLAFRWPVSLWAAVGIAVGLLFGALGAAHARRAKVLSTLGVALLVATFAAEAFILFRVGHPMAIQVAVPLEVIAAVILPLILLGSNAERLKTYVAALAFVPLVALGLASFMGVIHRVYPGI